MRSRLAAGFACAVLLVAGTVWRQALPGYQYHFPEDHFSHPDFQTEWWYYTGNLQSAEGKRFGYELTFFRHGVSRGQGTGSVWDVPDAWLAHLALSDISGRRFYHTERLNRPGPGFAGADAAGGLIWNGNWFSRWAVGGNGQQLEAITKDFTFRLALDPLKPPVIHGENGVSRKGPLVGQASHYISFTRLRTKGTVELKGQRLAVEGLSWMDHEFFTHQLSADQVGWDWFSIQFDDGSDLMLFRLRRKALAGSGAGKLGGWRSPEAWGELGFGVWPATRHGDFVAGETPVTDSPFSQRRRKKVSVTGFRRTGQGAGTWVPAEGASQHISDGEFDVTPGDTWRSRATGAVYPVAWTIDVRPLNLQLRLTTPLAGQEMTGNSAVSPSYWEGSIDVEGTRNGRPVRGRGYLEMTGYAGKIRI